ncbi:hypothetical protein BRAS3843_1350005 [Bradyrhizobium sp. STM 3843]|nr:hypothetical protein BRAS3843_1350005 [Bradyrhizobium sp. STM 3843]
MRQTNTTGNLRMAGIRAANISIVIPGHREAMSPESTATQSNLLH